MAGPFDAEVRVAERKASQLEKRLQESDIHFHTNAVGQLEACYHRCRGALTSVGFWVGMTIGFPFEHLLWEKAPLFSAITNYLGLA